MSMLPPLVLTGLALVLALAALLLLSGRGDRDLRDRARKLAGALPDGAAEKAVPLRLRTESHEERPLLVRACMLLGWDPEVPKQFMSPWPVLLGMSGLAAGLGYWLAAPRLGVVAAVGSASLFAVAVLMLMFRLGKARYVRRLFEQIPDAVALVLRAVRAGLPVSEAIRSIAQDAPQPTAGEFARIARETAIGVPIEVALWRLHRRCGLQEYAFLAVTIGLQAQTGGNLAETLSNLADLVRRRVAMAAKVRAITAEGRASAGILVGMPFVVGLVLMVIAPGYVSLLFTHPRGPAFLGAFVLLLGLGMLTINAMISRSTRD